MFKKIALPTLMSACLLSPVAMAAEDDNTDADTFTGQSGDKQGEANAMGGQGQQAGSQQSFTELDRNDDGQLDEEELGQMDQGSQGASEDILSEYDDNDDGQISEAEFHRSAAQNDEVAE